MSIFIPFLKIENGCEPFGQITMDGCFEEVKGQPTEPKLVLLKEAETLAETACDAFNDTHTDRLCSYKHYAKQPKATYVIMEIKDE